MSEYWVAVHERHVTTFLVEAENPEEARKKASRADTKELVATEWVDNIGDPADWNVELAPCRV